MNARITDVQSLDMGLGGIKLAVNGDMERVISFNPEGLAFIEGFYSLMADFESKEAEYQERAKPIDADTTVDKYGVPCNMPAKLALLRDICGYMRDAIDKVFGAGTSDTVFGNVNTLDMFEQFFNGVAPYIQAARNQKTAKYKKPSKTLS